MGKQIKKTIAILLAFCFLLSITATASVASPSAADTNAANNTVASSSTATPSTTDAVTPSTTDAATPSTTDAVTPSTTDAATPSTADTIAASPITTSPITTNPNANPITANPITANPSASPITTNPITTSPNANPSIGTDFLYIGDRGDNTVKRFDANSGIFKDNFVSSNSGGLYGPGGILFDKNGNLLVANQNVNQPGKSGEIFQYNGQTGVFEKALVPYTDKNAPFAPRGIILNNIKLYVASYISDDSGGPGSVRSYNAQDGTFLGDLPSVFQNVVFHPRGIVFGPDGYLYVSVMDVLGGNGGHVLRFKSDGSFDKVFIADDGGVGKLNRPEGLVFGPDGNLYITSFRADPTTDTDSIRIYSKEGVFLRKIDLDAVGATQDRAYAQAILFGPKERLFVPITNTGEVRRYNVHAGTYDSFVKAGGELKSPWYLTFGKTDSKTLEYRDGNNQNDNNQNDNNQN